MAVSKANPKDNYRLRREMPGYIPESQEHLWPVHRDNDRMPGFIPDPKTPRQPRITGEQEMMQRIAARKQGKKSDE